MSHSHYVMPKLELGKQTSAGNIFNSCCDQKREHAVPYFTKPVVLFIQTYLLKSTCNHMDLGKTLNGIIFSSAVILAYDGTAKSDSIASVLLPHNYVTQKGKTSRCQLNSIFQAGSLGSHNLQIIFKMFAAFCGEKKKNNNKPNYQTFFSIHLNFTCTQMEKTGSLIIRHHVQLHILHIPKQLRSKC